MLKKLITIAAAAVMCLSLSVTAFAAPSASPESSGDSNVVVTDGKGTSPNTGAESNTAVYAAMAGILAASGLAFAVGKKRA